MRCAVEVLPVRRPRSRTAVGAVIAVLVATVSLSGLSRTPLAAAAAPVLPGPIGLSKQGPGSILGGSSIAYTLTAVNPAAAGAVPEYNTTFRDTLPPGVTYKGGSTTPADVGDPRVITAQVHFPTATDPLVTQQTLIWSNVADLPVNGQVVLGYAVVPSASLYPVGSVITNTATDYASADPRLVPKFSATGALSASGNGTIAVGPNRSVDTRVSAITIAKSNDASPEGKLLRGAHGDVSIYSLLVTNNGYRPTINNAVVDYLPANLEFLGCGRSDNSAGPEYSGSGALGASRTPADHCIAPTRVETVTADGAGRAGIFTKVTWSIPDLEPSQSYTVRYAAAVPLKLNTAVFAGGTPAVGGPQGSNLDNNTGGSTRQVSAGQSVSNTAFVTGTYQGPTAADPTGAAGFPVSDSDTNTVVAKDVRVLKSVSTGSGVPGKQSVFNVGAVADYQLRVDSSEYVSAQAIVLTDRLENGLCPLVSAAQWAQLVADHPALSAVTGCIATDGQGPSVDQGPAVSYQSVAFDDATGAFTVVFTPIANLAAQSAVTVSYPARMLEYYSGGSLKDSETSAGDTFDNHVSLAARTTPVSGSPELGSASVTDTSTAELVTGAPAISKRIKPLPVVPATDYSCAGPDADYVDPADPALPAARTRYAVGDLICFDLTVRFPGGARTRNATITDFLPAGTAYVAGTAAAGPGNTVPGEQIALDASNADAGTLSWTLGHLSGGVRIVDPSATFEVRIAVRVTDPAQGSTVDIVGNLMKLRAENSAGAAISLRDDVNFGLAPAIAVGVTKGVASVNGVPAADFPADTDHQPVKQGDTVDFRVDVTHSGAAANGTDRALSAVTVWDALPALLRCADVVPSGTDGQECRDAAALGDWTPTVTGQSILRWTIPGPLAAGATTRLDYSVLVPKVGPGVTLANTAYVSSYTSDSDDGAGRAITYPVSNIDGSVPVAAQTAPAAADPSDLYTRPGVAAKTVASAITQSGNDGAGQAAVGELFTFTLSARVPAGLTVNAATLRDTLPANGLELLNAAYPPIGSYVPDASAPSASTALPAGFTVDPTSGTLSWPTSYTNTRATDELFQVTLTGRFTSAMGTQGTTRINTATFAYTPPGGSATTVSGNSTVTVVEPKPTLVKAVSPRGPYTAGQVITYQLTAGNAAGRPTAYDNWVVDCVPAGLSVSGYQADSPTQGATDPPAGGTGAGAGGNGCAVGTTRIGWHVGDLAGGATTSLFYQAVVDPAAAAGQSYKNTAGLTAASIPGVQSAPSDPLPGGARSYAAAANQTVAIDIPTLTKTATPLSGNVGTTVTYAVTARIPAQVNLYQAVLRDLLPAGIDPASLTSVSLTCVQTPGTCSVPLPAPSTAARGTGALATWVLGDLAAQPQIRTVKLTYTARIADVPAASRGAVLTNGAAIEWNPAPGGALPTFNSSDISARAPITVTAPVVHLSKTVDNTTPEPGQPFSYTLTATNGGGAGDTNVGPAYNLRISDAVPAGVTLGALPAGATLSGTNPDGSGGTVIWSIAGPLTANGSATVALPAVLAGSVTLTGAAQKNTGTVTDVYGQPDSGGRHDTPATSASATVTPDLPAVVPMKTTVTAGPAYAGGPFTWRITLTNTGRGRGYNLSASDVLPPRWAYQPGSTLITVAGADATSPDPIITPASGNNGPTLTWQGLAPLGAPASTGLSPGASVVITYTAIPGADAPTAGGSADVITNRVTAALTDATGAAGTTAGPYATGTGIASARIDAADITMTKSAGVFTAGGTGTWSLKVHNAGPDTAVGPFSVTDLVPAGLILPGGGAGAPLTVISAQGAGWACTVAAGDPLTCSRSNGDDTLAPGSDFPPIVITVSVPAEAAAGSTAVNSATVNARTYDPTAANNTDAATATVTTAADLEVAKVLSGPLLAGSNASYLLSVKNLGPSVSVASQATPITLTDTLPAGTTFVSATGTGWTCTQAAAVVTCRWTTTLGADGPPAAASPVTVTVAVPASRTADVVNTAAVAAGSTTDPRRENDTAAVTSTPVVNADLGLAKQLVDNKVAPVKGTDRFYDLIATDYGPADARDVTITDTLPAGVTSNGTWVDVSGSWTCDSAGRKVTCALTGSLPGPVSGVPQSRTVRISVHIPADYDESTPVVNTAAVTSSTDDPGPADNTATDTSTATGQADLALSKTITAAAVAGRSMTYALSVKNNGPSNAPAATVVRDTLPDGLTFSSAQPATPGWVCSVDTSDPQSLDCTAAAGITAGATTPTIPVRVDVAEDAQGPLVNSAAVSGPLFDPAPGNDVAARETPIGQLADVTITKKAAVASVEAGTDLSYAIVVSNNGPSTARGLTVVESPAAGLVVTSLSGSGWTCVLADLTCTRDALAVAAGPSTITVAAHVAASVTDGSLLDNDANLTVATAHSPGEPDWHTQDTVKVTAQAGVSLSKTHDVNGDPVDAGDAVTFTLTAANAGPSDAVGPVTILDTLPAGMTYLSAGDPWDCTADEQQVSCVLDPTADTIAAGGSAPALVLTVGIDPSVSVSSLINKATVTTATVQDPQVDDGASDTVSIATSADLSVVKTHTGSAVAGSQFAWAVTVANLGPSTSRADAAHPITVTDTLPAGTTFVSGGGKGFSCEVGDKAQQVVCTRTTDLAVDRPSGSATATFPITVAVAPSLRGGLSNSVTVTPGGTPEPAGPAAAGNNSGEDTAEVATRADLTLTKAHVPGSRAVAGKAFTWTVTVDNAGPSDSFADDSNPLVVTDTLPAGVTFTGSTSQEFSCAPTTASTVSCATTASLTPGKHTVTVTGLVDAAGIGEPGGEDPNTRTLTNTAAITSSTTPDDAGSNTAIDTVPLDTAADLSIVKSHAQGAVAVPGQPFSWTVQVTNDGPSVSRGTVKEPIRVADTLPESVTAPVGAGSGWDCTTSGQLVTCILGSSTSPADLPPGEAPRLTITGTITSGTTASLSNSATVSPGATADPDADAPAGNNHSTDIVDVSPQADLSIVKTHDASAVHVGSPLTFTLTVANHGPSVAQHAVVKDTLPAGLIPTAAHVDAGVCTVDGQDVSCSLDGGLTPLTIDGSAEVTVVIDATVTAAAYPTVDNVASVTSSTPDPLPANNSATDTVVVPPLVDLSLTKSVDGILAVGEQGRYLLTVSNVGPTADPGSITLTDTVPTGLTPVSAGERGSSSDRTSCTVQGQLVTCIVTGGLKPGDSIELGLLVDVLPGAYPRVTNTAAVTSPAADTDPTNNTAAVTSVVTASTALSLTKSLVGDGPGAGNQLDWQLTVDNAGPNDAAGPVVVVDELPTGLLYRGFRSADSSDAWSCLAARQTVTCTLAGTVVAGGRSSVVLATDLSATATGSIVNVASLAYGGQPTQVAHASYAVPTPPVPPTTSPAPTTPTPTSPVPTPTSPVPTPTTPSLLTTSPRSSTSPVVTSASATDRSPDATSATTSAAVVPATASDDAGDEPGSALPNTGVDVGGQLWAAVMFLVLGVSVVLVARRRQSATGRPVRRHRQIGLHR